MNSNWQEFLGAGGARVDQAMIEDFGDINAELAAEWPVITTRKDPLPDAKEWDGKPNKLPLLER